MARVTPPEPDRLDALGHLRSTLDDIANGEILISGGYERLRRRLLSDTELAPYLPEWLRSVRTVDEFRALVRATRDPAEFIRAALEPAFAYLEDFEFDLDKPEGNIHPLFRQVAFGRTTKPQPQEPLRPKDVRVFIVHGHDGGRRDAVARLVEQLGFRPIVLADEPNEGRTIIEKFEAHANVEYAIVLMTPDDMGGATNGPMRQRARQNVVLELGFFIGLLKRANVAALVVGDIEKPSDISGVLYVQWDELGAWRGGIAREMRAAGLPVDMNLI